jgi:RNA polymerase sigma factor (sigma-70 family)
VAQVVTLTAQLRVRYTKQERRQQAIDALVVKHMGLAEQIARRVFQRYTRAGQDGYTSQISLSDMVSYAYIGLVEAARRYDAAAGEFPKFAYRRIRGAIIDAHRRGAYRDMQALSIEAQMPEGDQDVRTARGTGSVNARGRQFQFEHMRDAAPLADESLAQREVEQLAVRAIRMLPDDERVVLIDALRGAGLEESAAARGRSVAWARAKLAIAREKVASQVAREQRAA